jgi:hypothetical protein
MPRGLASLAAGALLAASAASAQPAPAGGEDDVHRHRGLFVRLDGGLGYLRSSSMLNGEDASLSGLAMSLGFSLGGNVREDLSVFGHAAISSAPGPSASLGGSSGGSDAWLNLVSVGPGVSYYFMPSNVYVSAVLSLTGLFAAGKNRSGNSEVGLGARFAVGKEWWVGDRWGIGVAGQFSFGSNQDQGSAAHWKTISPALAFSATFH